MLLHLVQQTCKDQPGPDMKTTQSNNTPVIHLLDCVAVQNGTAATLEEEIEKALTTRHILISKIATLAADGASVMMGKHNGVGTELRQAYNLCLIQVHCLAH